MLVWSAVTVFVIVGMSSWWLDDGLGSGEVDEIDGVGLRGRVGLGVGVDGGLMDDGGVERLSKRRSSLIGFAINLHHTDEPWRYREAVDEVVAMGCNAVLVVTPAWQTDGGAIDVRIEAGVGRGSGRGELVGLLRYAKSRGLYVGLMPTVLFTHPRGNEWRGKLHPSGGADGWDAWWLAYRAVIDAFVDMALESDVDLFVVGSELLSTEQQTDRWSGLIASVRLRFDGELIYSTNWDHYHVPGFWDQLDAIGVSAYYDLTIGTNGDAPDAGSLAKRWQQIRGELREFGKQHGRPILFTELGYPSLPWGVKHPWNYTNPEAVEARHDIQQMGYAAFMGSFTDLPKGEVGDFRGVFFYQWDVYYHGGPDDVGYGVDGKPSRSMIERWMSGGVEVGDGG